MPDPFVSSRSLDVTVDVAEHDLRGQDMPGRARMAAARLAAQADADARVAAASPKGLLAARRARANVTLDRVDVEALRVMRRETGA